MLAACDAVGATRALSDWIALPELLHVGSTLLGAASGPHEVNAGCMCSSIAQRLLERVRLPAEMRCELYDCYFTALRAGQAGQGLEIEGLMARSPRLSAMATRKSWRSAALHVPAKDGCAGRSAGADGRAGGRGEGELPGPRRVLLSRLGFQPERRERDPQGRAVGAAVRDDAGGQGSGQVQDEAGQRQIVDALRGTAAAPAGRERLCPLVRRPGCAAFPRIRSPTSFTR